MPTHDIDGRRIAIVGGSIALVVALVVVVVFLLLHAWQMPARTDRVRLPYQALLPVPALQAAPQLDLAAYRAEKQRILDGSAWVDAQQGIARIPIASAMQLLAQEPQRAASAPEAQR
jgi:hypothetical protein